jgi:cytoskeletal protein CcmA (bactofilin family)
MTTIGASLIVTGDITSQEDITIHGCVNGQIRMDKGALLVAPKGTVDAEVQGTHITIHGTMAGNVLATDRVELTPTADVTGTLTAPAVVLQDGATFNGTIDMDRKAKKDKAPVKSGPMPVEPVAKAS